MKLQNFQLNFYICVSILKIKYNICGIKYNIKNNVTILVLEFQILFSKENEMSESPRMREFRKKLRERTPIGIYLS